MSTSRFAPVSLPSLPRKAIHVSSHHNLVAFLDDISTFFLSEARRYKHIDVNLALYIDGNWVGYYIPEIAPKPKCSGDLVIQVVDGNTIWLAAYNSVLYRLHLDRLGFSLEATKLILPSGSWQCQIVNATSETCWLYMKKTYESGDGILLNCALRGQELLAIRLVKVHSDVGALKESDDGSLFLGFFDAAQDTMRPWVSNISRWLSRLDGDKNIHVVTPPSPGAEIFFSTNCFVAHTCDKKGMREVYYTDDPNRGWKRLTLQMKSSATLEDVRVFDTGSFIYVNFVFTYHQNTYVFSLDHPNNARFVAKTTSDHIITPYNGQLIIYHPYKRVRLYGQVGTPYNEGGLIYDPYTGRMKALSVTESGLSSSEVSLKGNLALPKNEKPLLHPPSLDPQAYS